MLDGVAQRCERLLLLRRILRSWRVHVVDEDHGRAGAVGDLADEPIMRDLVAEHPPAGVGVEDDRQDLGGTGGSGTHDTDSSLARWTHRPYRILDPRIL